MAGIHPTYGRLALEIERAGLSLPQIATVANILRCPMSEHSRKILLAAARKHPFKLPISQYQITDLRRGRSRTVRHFSLGLQLMNKSPEDYLAGDVPAARLSFAIWVGSVTRDPVVLGEASAGLRHGYRCPITTHKLNDWINGHRVMSRTAKLLLTECIKTLCHVQVLKACNTVG